MIKAFTFQSMSLTAKFKFKILKEEIGIFTYNLF